MLFAYLAVVLAAQSCIATQREFALAVLALHARLVEHLPVGVLGASNTESHFGGFERVLLLTILSIA